MLTPDDCQTSAPAVVFDSVSLAFDDKVVLRDVSFAVDTGSMTFLLGASGSGKSVILKLVLGLLRPDSGAIYVNGERTDTMSEAELMRIRDDIGMLFQESALFDSLTVAENVGYKLSDETNMPADEVRARVAEVLGFVGLSEHIDRMPSQLSGGQRRRVAIARAIAARPHLLLFDDPTVGLDPILSKTVDAEIIKLRDLQGVTSIVVTHQLPDAFFIARHQARRSADNQIEIVEAERGRIDDARFLMLKDAGIYFQGSPRELLATEDPFLQTYLSGWVPPLG